MARRVGLVARSEIAGSAGNPSGRRWFVNPAEDLCTEYEAEAGELLCDPAALRVDVVVTFEIVGRRAARLRILADEEDYDAIRAAMNCPIGSVRQAVPALKAARVGGAALPQATAGVGDLQGRPLPATSREPPGTTDRNGHARGADRLGGGPVRPSVPIKIPDAGPATDGLPPDKVAEAPRSPEPVPKAPVPAAASPRLRIPQPPSDRPGAAAKNDGLPPGPPPGSVDGRPPAEVRARESWAWQVPTPAGMVDVNVGTPASPTPPIVLPSAIADFFERHVAKPFEGHSSTADWVAEVIGQSESYHRERIACQGQTDFDAPHNSLPAADKVLVYCYYYLQMHVASTLYVYDQAMWYSGLGLAPHTVFVDFGSGPLTLPLSLAWLQHLRLTQDEPPSRLRLHYLGIEQSGRMIEQAKHFLEDSGLFHHGPTFRFIRSFLPASALRAEIDALLPSSDGLKSDIVLNLSYFIASRSVAVEDLAPAVRAILRTYPSRRVWLVFQNPCRHSSFSKWQRFRQGVPELRLISSGEETIGYTNSTNRKATWKTELCHEVLVRDPVGADNSPPRHQPRSHAHGPSYFGPSAGRS